MTADVLKAILESIPKDQHESAQRRIALAEMCGWQDIGIWVWIAGREDQADLVGTNNKGDFDFLS